MSEVFSKKGFTLIELMIIVAIIGILAAVLLSMWAVSAQKKAAVNSYKTSMNSVATAIEMCVGAGGIANSGGANSIICDQSRYPLITTKCGSSPYFGTIGSGGNWSITTYTDNTFATPWDCKGCRMLCTASGCQKIESSPGDCK